MSWSECHKQTTLTRDLHMPQRSQWNCCLLTSSS